MEPTKSWRTGRGRDLLALVGASALFLVGTYAIPGSPIVAAWSVPYLLLAPGYAALCALWASSFHSSPLVASLPRRLSLAFVVSLFVTPGLSLLLSQTPIGLTEPSSALLVSGLTLTLTAVAALRRGRNVTVPPRPRPLVPKVEVITVGFIVLVAVSTVAAVSIIRSQSGPLESFTELYLLDDQGTAYQFPETIQAGSPLPFTLVLHSHEREEYAFTLVGRILREETSEAQEFFRVNGTALPGQRETYAINATLQETGIYDIEFDLLRDGGRTYRSVNLWMEVVR